MPGQMVHIEIPADDTEKAREFWGSLFGWQFEAYPGQPVRVPHDPNHRAVRRRHPATWSLANKGTRSYFDVDDVDEGAARVKKPLGGEADTPMPVPSMGWFVHLQGHHTETSSASGRPTRPHRHRPSSRSVNRRRRTRAPPVVHPAYAFAAASSRTAMSSFLICSIVAMTRWDFSRVRIADQLEQNLRHDLPRQPEPVLQPAARAFLSSFQEAVPVPVDLLLALADQLERDGLAEGELGASVDRRELLAVQLEARPS